MTQSIAVIVIQEVQPLRVMVIISIRGSSYNIIFVEVMVIDHENVLIHVV
jgi:hypothetical protein